MQRERDTNLDIDGKRTAERRFQYQPGERQQSTQDMARQNFWALPPARKDVLRFYCKYGLRANGHRVGWAYTDMAANGSLVGTLADTAAIDCGFEVSASELAGALLFERFGPTISTAHKDYADWIVCADYVGIPAQLSQQWDDLRAAA
jgi:hypothetical protein